MQKNCISFILLFSWYAALMPVHPRAQSAMKAIQNQLPQLQMRYDPSVVQSVQYYIDLLRQLEPVEADKYQQQLNAFISNRASQPLQVPSRPASPAVPVPRPPIKPPVDVAPVVAPTIPTPPPLPQPVRPPTPSAPPTDLPPAPPAPTDVPVPPTPPAPRPLPCTPDVAVKKELENIQQRTLQLLEKFVPRIKGKSVVDAKGILKQELRNYIVEASRRNAFIKESMNEIRSGNKIARHVRALDFDILIKTYESLGVATDLCQVVYADHSFTDYFKEVRTDFYTVTFGYAQALVDNITRMLADTLPSVRDTITSEEGIGDATSVIIDLATTVHVLELVHLPRITLNLEPSPAQKKLIASMIDLFTTLQDVLVQTRMVFDDQQVLPLWLKVAQKNFYDLVASVLNTYVDAMPGDALSGQQKKDLYEKMKTTLAHMQTSLLKIRIGQNR